MVNEGLAEEPIALRDLDRGFHELLRFLDRSPLADAQAAAIASFLGAVPRDLRGGSYYFEELTPRLLGALESTGCRLADPDLRSAVSALLARTLDSMGPGDAPAAVAHRDPAQGFAPVRG